MKKKNKVVENTQETNIQNNNQELEKVEKDEYFVDKNGKKKKIKRKGVGEIPQGFEDGKFDSMRLLFPGGIDSSNPDYYIIDNVPRKAFKITGYPSLINVGWLTAMYEYPGSLDTIIHITPAEERNALNELTSKITQFEAQLDTELERGSNKNITRLKK